MMAILGVDLKQSDVSPHKPLTPICPWNHNQLEWGAIHKLDQDITHSHPRDNETQAPLCGNESLSFPSVFCLCTCSQNRALQPPLAWGPVEISTMRSNLATKTLKPLVVIFMSSVVNPPTCFKRLWAWWGVVCFIFPPMQTWMCAFVLHSDRIFSTYLCSCRGSLTNKLPLLKTHQFSVLCKDRA